ncbi:hypothetical protein GGX14DRAFT_674309 [Mycena pura]|uniref:C2H2-type domain-containing protein n=1 Tax=Mycena pura TaxID=153505 RepID=A0AAD6UW14_9AGAR|nr:hypothetical protein GGX14DRAFT_674309 [Mycena pura]
MSESSSNRDDAPEASAASAPASNVLGLPPVLTFGEYNDRYVSQCVPSLPPAFLSSPQADAFSLDRHPIANPFDLNPVAGGQRDYVPAASRPSNGRPDVQRSVRPVAPSSQTAAASRGFADIHHPSEGINRAGPGSQDAQSSSHRLDVPRAYPPPYAPTGEVMRATHPPGYPAPAPASFSFTATFNMNPGAFWQAPNAIQPAYNPYHAPNYAPGAWGPHQPPSFPPLPTHVPPSTMASGPRPALPPGPPPALPATSSALQPQSMAPASSTRAEPSWEAMSVLPLTHVRSPSNTVRSTETGRPRTRTERPLCPKVGVLQDHEIRAIVRAAAVADAATEFHCRWAGCQALVQLGKLWAHLSVAHGCLEGMLVRCAWAGCMYQDAMEAGSLVKHLRSETHLNIKTRCVGCNSDFARPDALGRHLRGSKGKEKARARATARARVIRN